MIRNLRKLFGLEGSDEPVRARPMPLPQSPLRASTEHLVASTVLGNTLIITVLEPELHADRAAELNHDVRALMAVHRACRNLVLDLQNVEYIDSSGLNTMIDLLQVVRAAGGTIAIAAPTQQVEVLFKLTRLELVFSIRRTVIEAIESVERRAA